MFGNEHQQYGNFAKNTGKIGREMEQQVTVDQLSGRGGGEVENERYLLKTASYTIFWEDSNQIISYVLVVIT